MTKKATKTTERPSLPKTGYQFTKMTGTGNDFLIFDARDPSFPKFDRSLFSQSLCRRSLSVGADGVVFIEKSKRPDAAFKWDFYNADGSTAEMCGNAARCVARYALENNIAGQTAAFESLAGIIKTKIHSNGVVEVEMPAPKIIADKVVVPLGEHLSVDVLYVDTGVPHIVKLNDDWEDEYLQDLGRYLRHHELFKETNGANVTFYEVGEGSQIHSATYERGVEAVTLACGTGAVAAATAAVLNGMAPPIEVKVPGGILNVDINKEMTRVVLSGEARFICQGVVRPEALL